MVTLGFDIEDTGRVVGTDVDAAAKFHGFLRDTDGAITTIDFPGAGDTTVFGINNSGQLAGAHREAPDFIYTGFVSDGGEFTNVDVPGAIAGDAAVNDVDDRGRLVGDYDLAISGYLRSTRGNSPPSMPPVPSP